MTKCFWSRKVGHINGLFVLEVESGGCIFTCRKNQTNGRKTSTVYLLLKATLPWRWTDAIMISGETMACFRHEQCAGIFETWNKFCTFLYTPNTRHIKNRSSTDKERPPVQVAWPSGLRRWIKAAVSPGAWVRIPPLPSDFSFYGDVFFASLSVTVGVVNKKKFFTRTTVHSEIFFPNFVWF